MSCSSSFPLVRKVSSDLDEPDVAPGVIYEFLVDLPEHFRYCFPGNPGQLSASRTRDLACAMLPNTHRAFDSTPAKRYLSNVLSK